jgi:biotin operon repressor
VTLYGKRLKSPGIAVYNVLASYANQETQTCFPTQRSIARHLGLSRTTVNRKIGLLRELGLVRVMKEKSRCLYYLLRPDVSDSIQPCSRGDTGSVSPENTNNNNGTRIINNFDDKNILMTGFKSFKEFRPQTKEELLALDAASALNDFKSLPLYLKYAQMLPEPLIRQKLSWIKQIPEENIKRSRAALFNWVIKKYVKRYHQKHRDQSGDQVSRNRDIS